MRATLSAADGSTVEATPDLVRRRLSDGAFFWLDIEDDGSAAGELLGCFGFHPLAVEDAERFGQRPKFEQYDDFTYLVVHGAVAQPSVGTVELHVFYAAGHVVTVRREAGVVDDAALETVRARLSRHTEDRRDPGIVVLYLVVDAMVDSFFPVLSDFDDRIDELEDAILRNPTQQQISELFDMKRALVTLRKAVTPQRDMFAALLSDPEALPGMTRDDERYFRDLYDHLIRISDLVDSYRDLLSGALDTHVSTVSNRMNGVMKQLTIIATVFLPLSFITGFFGQNFRVLVVDYIHSAWAFWAFGIGLEVATFVGLLVYFRKKGWLGGPTV